MSSVTIKKKQTLDHLMYTCESTQIIWNSFKEFIVKNTNIDVNELQFNCKTIMLNTFHTKPGHLANLLGLIVKQHIYACKCKEVDINVKEISKSSMTIIKLKDTTLTQKGMKNNMK